MLIYLIALAGTAVVFADILVRPGMLLEPVQRLARWAYSHAFGNPKPGIYRDLDSQWWWAPLWGCYKCVAGQWGFWGYLIRYHGHYQMFEHLAFTAFTIIAAILLSKWTQQ
jgi:hypothetical protein